MAKPRKLRGFVFVIVRRRSTGPLAGLAQVKKLTVRKSGIQARHLYISARERSGLRHAGKLAYPAKPPNGESLDRPIRAHKKQGNHPAGVIVDMQSPCHGTPPGPRAPCGFNARNPLVGSDARNRLHGGGNLSMQVGYSLLCGKEGAVETAAPPSSGAALREILEVRRRGYEQRAEQALLGRLV